MRTNREVSDYFLNKIAITNKVQGMSGLAFHFLVARADPKNTEYLKKLEKQWTIVYLNSENLKESYKTMEGYFKD